MCSSDPSHTRHLTLFHEQGERSAGSHARQMIQMVSLQSRHLSDCGYPSLSLHFCWEAVPLWAPPWRNHSFPTKSSPNGKDHQVLCSVPSLVWLHGAQELSRLPLPSKCTCLAPYSHNNVSKCEHRQGLLMGAGCCYLSGFHMRSKTRPGVLTTSVAGGVERRWLGRIHWHSKTHPMIECQSNLEEKACV